MRSINMDRILHKLNGLLKSRFDVDVEYIPLSDSDVRNSITIETVKRNSGAPMIVSFNQVIIPVRIEGSLVGAARVKRIRNLKPTHLSQVVETIDLVLGAALDTQARLEAASDVIDLAKHRSFQTHSA